MAVCNEHSGLVADVNNIKSWQEKHMNNDHKEIWGAIEVMRTDIKNLVNRPPVWCTVVISLLAGAAGWFAK